MNLLSKLILLIFQIIILQYKLIIKLWNKYTGSRRDFDFTNVIVPSYSGDISCPRQMDECDNDVIFKWVCNFVFEEFMTTQSFFN